MRFLFLNQYFPPDPAPTGILLRELADELVKAGHTVDFVAARQEYRAGQKQGGRMKRELFALWRMLLDAIRRPKADVVISLSSPPCLSFVAALIALRHRAHAIHWVMDLYPEIAVALGEVREGLLSKTIGALMGWSYRRCTKVVVLDEDMAERLRRYGVEPAIIRPWVFRSVLARLPAGPVAPVAEWTWIYSGNLGRAHEWQTLLEAQALLEKKGAGIQLVFQGGGPSWQTAQAKAAELGLRQIEWRGYVDEAELPASLESCQVLAVSQLPEVKGLLWPSKLGLITALSRPILWVGPVDSAVGRWLRNLPHAALFEPGQAAPIATWLISLKNQTAPAPTQPLNPAAYRDHALERWRQILSDLS